MSFHLNEGKAERWKWRRSLVDSEALWFFSLLLLPLHLSKRQINCSLSSPTARLTQFFTKLSNIMTKEYHLVKIQSVKANVQISKVKFLEFLGFFFPLIL